MLNIFLATACLLTSVASRTFTVYNACPFTIWPAIFTDSQAAPDFPTGWEAPAGSQVSFNVPDNWRSGRIWGRRDCNFKASNPSHSCSTGGCNGGLLCSGTGVPPATLAEWTFDGKQDFYDVSLVDGYNLPMSITNDKGCHIASCPADLAQNCPVPLRVNSSAGLVVGCKSACLAYQNSTDCCTPPHDTAATCPSSGVQHYNYFKDNCKDSYVYAFDEPSNSALWTCDSQKKANYNLTFCPSAKLRT